jgi:hypothetical protein
MVSDSIRSRSLRGEKEDRVRTLPVALVLAVLAATAACISEPEPRVLSISVTVEESPVALGDSAIFSVAAEGPRLVEFEVEFGDGRVFSDDGHLAVELTRRISHLYEEPGSYQVIARVVDQGGFVESDQASVQVVE